MTKLDLLDVLNGIPLEAIVMINLDGELVPVRQIDATTGKVVFFPEFDFGSPVFTEVTDDEVDAALSADEFNLPEPGEDPHDYAERLFKEHDRD